MKIIVNGAPRDIKGSYISEALEELGFPDQEVATALNEVFIARVQRASVELNEGDRLEVVAPMQGG